MTEQEKTEREITLEVAAQISQQWAFLFADPETGLLITNVQVNNEEESARALLRAAELLVASRLKLAGRDEGVLHPIADAPRTGEHILGIALGKKGFGLCGGKRQDTAAVIHWWAEPGEEGWYLSLGNCDDEQKWPTHFQYMPAESASLKLAAADRLAEAYAEHVCACEQPYCGAQPVGVFRCERCGKCCADSLRSALLEYSRTTV